MWYWHVESCPLSHSICRARQEEARLCGALHLTIRARQQAVSVGLQTPSMYAPATSGNLCWTSAIIFLNLSVHGLTSISILTLHTILNHNRQPPENSTPCPRPPGRSRLSVCLVDVRSQPLAHGLKAAVITLLLLIYVVLFYSHLEQCPLRFIFRVDTDPSLILPKQSVSALVAS